MAILAGPGSELTITNLILDMRNILDGISGYPEKHLANLDRDSIAMTCYSVLGYLGVLVKFIKIA